MKQLEYPLSIANAIEQFKKLPGIGARGAERMVLNLLRRGVDEIILLERALVAMGENVSYCTECGFFSTDPVCSACGDEVRRHHGQFCVVEQPTDVLPIEQSGAYRGLYHCLGGKLSPLDDVEPENLRIKELIDRVHATAGDIEVIIATSADVEGEATANYLTALLKSERCKITRIAQGIPVGTGLGHADSLTLSRALQNRTDC